MRRPIYWISALILAAQTAVAGQWIEGRVTHVRDIVTIDVNGLHPL